MVAWLGVVVARIVDGVDLLEFLRSCRYLFDGVVHRRAGQSSWTIMVLMVKGVLLRA